jgi:hypothetical protein
MATIEMADLMAFQKLLLLVSCGYCYLESVRGYYLGAVLLELRFVLFHNGAMIHMVIKY